MKLLGGVYERSGGGFGVEWRDGRGDVVLEAVGGEFFMEGESLAARDTGARIDGEEYAREVLRGLRAHAETFSGEYGQCALVGGSFWWVRRPLEA